MSYLLWFRYVLKMSLFVWTFIRLQLRSISIHPYTSQLHFAARQAYQAGLADVSLIRPILRHFKTIEPSHTTEEVKPTETSCGGETSAQKKIERLSK